jgi:tetratricopeptide (TPR) repeat protein
VSKSQVNQSHEEFALLAEPYVLGELSPEATDAFEEHYFSCDACLEQVQTLQALQASLRQEPAPEQRKTGWFAWPVRWQLGVAMATVLLVAAGALWRYSLRPGRLPSETANTQSIPAPRSVPPSPVPTPEVAPQTVAELELPPYAPPRLRGASAPDEHFSRGMSAYQAGNCAAAAAQLRQVVSSSPQWDGAEFYRAVCLLKLGDASGASAALRLSAHSDSAYQEAAHYYLAQADIALGKSDQAVKLLRQLVSAKGDYADRAAAKLQTLK